MARQEVLGLQQSIEEWILSLPNVTKTPHRFGGTEYRVHGLEFMHSHGPKYLDIRLSKQDQERVLKDGKAEHHRFAPQAEWVTFRIRQEEDIETAKELAKLAYDNAEKMMTEHASRGESKQSKLRLLGFSELDKKVGPVSAFLNWNQ